MLYSPIFSQALSCLKVFYFSSHRLSPFITSICITPTEARWLGEARGVSLLYLWASLTFILLLYVALLHPSPDSAPSVKLNIWRDKHYWWFKYLTISLHFAAVLWKSYSFLKSDVVCYFCVCVLADGNINHNPMLLNWDA